MGLLAVHYPLSSILCGGSDRINRGGAMEKV